MHTPPKELRRKEALWRKCQKLFKAIFYYIDEMCMKNSPISRMSVFKASLLFEQAFAYSVCFSRLEK